MIRKLFHGFVLVVIGTLGLGCLFLGILGFTGKANFEIEESLIYSFAGIALLVSFFSFFLRFFSKIDA